MSDRKYHRVTVDDNFPIVEFERLDFPEQSYLGHGGFATVRKARHRDWKQDVAVKLLRKTEGCEQEQLYSEARKLNLGSRSDHVISLLGVCLDPNFAIVMPYMENGSLAGLLREVDVPWALRWRMAHEISLGMTFLHCQNPQILHCDLKAENVLLDGDFHVKISDFGLSKWRTESRIVTATSPTGATITHAPPEYIADINLLPNAKFDVYSFGVLLWEIITKRIPFENAINTALIERGVRTGQRPDMRLVPTDVPDVNTVSQLMQTCWSENPEDRPSFMECEDQLKAVKNKCRKETFHEAIIYIITGKEQQKTREAGLKAKEQEREVQQLYKELEDMKKAQQETLEKQQQQHKEQMEKDHQKTQEAGLKAKKLERTLQQLYKELEDMKKAQQEILQQHKEQMEKEQQKTQEAGLKSEELERELRQLRLEGIKKAQMETLEKQQQQHKEQMEKFKQQMAERQAREEKEMQDPKNTRMHMARERSERELEKAIERLKQEQADSSMQMAELMGRVMTKTTHPPPSERCTTS